MKAVFVALLVALGSLSALAKEAVIVNERVTGGEGCLSEWTPLALTLCGPVGLPWGDWNVSGLQVGFLNCVNELTGLQVGLVNIADRVSGFQVGFINVITTDDVPFLPIVNWSF